MDLVQIPIKLGPFYRVMEYFQEDVSPFKNTATLLIVACQIFRDNENLSTIPQKIGFLYILHLPQARGRTSYAGALDVNTM